MKNDVTPSQWKPFLDQFSKRNSLRPTRLEVIGEEFGAQEEEKYLPLVGISYETKGEASGSVVIMLGGETPADERHLDHTITGVERIMPYIGRDGLERGLEIENKAGVKTILRFEQLPELEDEETSAVKEFRPSGYGYSRTLDLPFEQAFERAREALKTEGFGVLCEIDIREKLKEKLGVEFRRYTIIGACSPPLAYQALQQELEIGLLLPCNVIVYEDEGKSVVAAIDAAKMMAVAGNTSIEAIASKVNEKLRRVIDTL